MLVQSHDTDRLGTTQLGVLIGDTWETEVVPRLPQECVAQARALKAFQRVRGLATPHDLLRGLLAYVLGPFPRVASEPGRCSSGSPTSLRPRGASASVPVTRGCSGS